MEIRHALESDLPAVMDLAVGLMDPLEAGPLIRSHIERHHLLVADEGDRVIGFEEAPLLPHWAHCGLDVLDAEALARLPERGDHERTTFPELAAEGKLRAFFHEGIWLTVHTPKELRVATEFVASHPSFAAPR